MTTFWSMHVAPFVYDKQGNRIILDVALSDQPLSESKWRSLFVKSVKRELVFKAFLGWYPKLGDNGDWVEYDF